MTLSGSLSTFSVSLPATAPDWNLIGAPSTPTSFSTLLSSCQSPDVQEYDPGSGGYVFIPLTSSTVPGRAYWVSVAQPCTATA